MGSFLVLAILAAVLGMFQFGYYTGVINAPQTEIQKFLKTSFKERYDRDIDDFQAESYFSGAVTIGVVGGLVGAITGGWLADKFGRRRGLLLAQGLSLLGGVFQGSCRAANSYELLMLGRLLFGLACGLFTGLSPLYLAEIAPVKIRGAIGTLNQLAVTCGIFTSMVLGLNSVLGSEQRWPVLLCLNVVPALVQVVLLVFMPETPRYLILTKNKVEEGRTALRKLRGTDDVEDEINEILEENEREDTASLGVMDLFKDSGLRLALFICVCMHLSQQLSGINGIFYYSTSFFRSAGIDCDASQYATMCVGAIMVGMTFVTVPLMDRVGRRVLHLTGLTGIFVCSILIMIAYVLNDGQGVECGGDAPTEDPKGTTGAGVFLIVSTLSFVVFFAMGPGSIPWMSAGELFTQKSRAAASSLVVFVNWLGNLAVGLLFPVLTTYLKEYSFLPFTIIVFVLLLTLTFYFPETKNRSTVDVASLFDIKDAWKTPIGIKSNKLLSRAKADH